MPRKKNDLPQVGDIVYLLTDPDRNPRLVVKFKVDEGSVKYKLAYGTLRTWHYGIELTNETCKRTEVSGFNINKQKRQPCKSKGSLK